MQPTLEAKKLWSSALQVSFDRARSEQYSLLVAVTHCDMRTNRWEELAQQLTPVISNFAAKLSAHCDKSVHQVQKKCSSLVDLSSSLSSAESVRLPLSSASSSAVSPLDALARGHFGEEIADLVNRLRASAEDISGLSKSLQQVQQQMMTDIAAEVATLVKCGDSLGSLRCH